MKIVSSKYSRRVQYSCDKRKDIIYSLHKFFTVLVNETMTFNCECNRSIWDFDEEVQTNDLVCSGLYFPSNPIDKTQMCATENLPRELQLRGLQELPYFIIGQPFRVQNEVTGRITKAVCRSEGWELENETGPVCTMDTASMAPLIIHSRYIGKKTGVFLLREKATFSCRYGGNISVSGGYNGKIAHVTCTPLGWEVSFSRDGVCYSVSDFSEVCKSSIIREKQHPDGVIKRDSAENPLNPQINAIPNRRNKGTESVGIHNRSVKEREIMANDYVKIIVIIAGIGGFSVLLVTIILLKC